MKKITKLNSSSLIMFFLLLLTTYTIQEISNTNSFQAEFEPNKFTNDDLKIFDSKLGVFLHIGMTMKEITKIYGEADEIDMFGSHLYEGLHVFYRNQVAVQFIFSTTDNLTNRYLTYRQIGLGDKKEKVLTNYGQDFSHISDLYGSTEISYYIQKNGDKLEPENEDDKYLDKNDGENSFIIDFVIDGIVTYILIGDIKSATTLK